MKMLCVSTWPFKNKFLQLTINGAMGFRDTKCLYLSGTISELYIIGVKKNKKFTIDLFPKNIFFNSNPSNTFLQKHYATKITKINTIINSQYQ